MLLRTHAGTLLVPQLGSGRFFDHVQGTCMQAARSVSWKTRATEPSRESSGGSNSRGRGRGGSSSRGGGGWSDSRQGQRRSSRGGDGSSRDGGWDDVGQDAPRNSFGNSRGRSSNRDRGGSRGSSSRDAGGSGRQQQQWQRPVQQQQRQWQESSVGSAGDDDSWRDDAYGDDYAADDGEFLYPARPSKASYKEQLFGEALYGVAPVLAALQAGIRTPHVLLMQEGLSPQQRKDSRALSDIQRLVIDKGATVRSVSKHELNMLAGNRPHQGLILDASPLQWEPLDMLPSLEELEQQQQQQAGGSSNEAEQQAAVKFPVWLALDEVMDPQNLGAMLRSAYCLGASGVIGCSRNCAPLTPVVSKASAGAAELMPLHSCRSMPRTLADAAEKGWAVVGAAAESGSVPVSEFKVDRPTVLVMGNEGYGLRATVKRCCTQLVQIKMAPLPTSSSSSSGVRQQQLVDSLNVSVATGILLHQLLTTARQ